MGRTKYIESPETMWDLFLEYGTAVKAKPILKHDYVGKDAVEVLRKIERPLTMEGFQNHLRGNDIINDLGDYFSNKDKRYTNYATVCLRIKDTIRQDQIEGGMAGIYNPSITQRLNGLVEKTAADDKRETTITVIRGDRNKIE